MTKIISRFAIGDATLQNGAQLSAESGSLPERVDVASNPHDLQSLVDSLGATTHYDYYNQAGCPKDRLAADVSIVVPPDSTSLGPISRMVQQIKERKSMIGYTTNGTQDMRLPHNASTNSYDYNQTWSMELFGRSTTAGRATVAKFDGSTNIGWVLRVGSPANTDVRVEFWDGGPTPLDVQCTTGTNLVANSAHVVVTVAGVVATPLMASAIEIYVDGVQQTKVVNTDPGINSFANTGYIESGNFAAQGAPYLSIFDRQETHWDHWAMYPSVLTPSQVTQLYQTGVGTQTLPTATWQFTSVGATTVNTVSVPGALANLHSGDDFFESNQVKVRTYYSKNGGARTEFREAVDGLSIALADSETFEVIAEWQPSGSFDSAKVGFVGSDCGCGPMIIYDDGAGDTPPTAPPSTPATTTFGVGGRLVINP